MTDADVAAMQRLAAGENLALNEIMARWQQRVASLLFRMTGNHTTACDLAQETFVKLYHSRTRFKANAPFAGYLLRIAANLARNHHRWRSRHPSESLDVLQETEMEPAAISASPDAALSQADTTRAVQQAVRELPNDLRMALELFTYEDMSYADIATALDCTVKAVESRIYRARQILKSELQHLKTASSTK